MLIGSSDGPAHAMQAGVALVWEQLVIQAAHLGLHASGRSRQSHLHGGCLTTSLLGQAQETT